MDDLPEVKPATNPHDDPWLEQALTTMVEIARRYVSPIEIIYSPTFERDMEKLDRLAKDIHEYSERLKHMLPPGG